jgi:hypothetical protein
MPVRAGHARLRPDGGQAPHFTRRAGVFRNSLNSRGASASGRHHSPLILRRHHAHQTTAEKEIIMSLIAIMQGTPTWVWLLLAFLIYRGVNALHSRTTPLSKLAIIPLIFAAMGIAHLVSAPLVGWAAVAAWVVGLGAGFVGGVFNASRSRFIVDPIALSVTSPGSFVPLVLILATFATKFWLGFELATVTNIAALASYVVIDAAVSGVVAGMFAGRFFTYWKAVQTLRASWA